MNELLIAQIGKDPSLSLRFSSQEMVQTIVQELRVDHDIAARGMNRHRRRDRVPQRRTFLWRRTEFANLIFVTL